MLLVRGLQVGNTIAGFFLFNFFSLLLWMCASVMPLGYCVAAKVGCNGYLHDVNIFSLLKKILTGDDK
jgi:hypothetical protein